MPLLLIFTDLSGQRKAQGFYPEIGLMVGASYYIGDINPYRHFGSETYIGGFGGFYKANLTRRHVLRFQVLNTRIQAHDNQNNDPNLVNRNLHFRSDITEFSMMLEINYYSFRIGDKYERFTSYVFGGFSMFNMNPQAEFEGQWYDLQTLHTEGQTTEGLGEEYKRNQLAIPFGIGVKYAITERLALSAEWSMRRTFTDYLDDVSGLYVDPNLIRETAGELGAQLSDRSLETTGFNGNNRGVYRGDPDHNDWFVFADVGLSMRLGKNYTSCWRGHKAAKKF